VVVQKVQGRQNRGQWNYARGAVATGNRGAQNRVGNTNPGQAKQIKCYNLNLSSADPIYDDAGLSYDSDILSEEQDHDNYLDSVVREGQRSTNKVVNESLMAELARYKEQVQLYEIMARNNREVHLDYLKHLKESVETLCEIVEEVRIEKPLDDALENA
nr:hypothetical protein [Tanacetum cinerariifolium]